MRALLVLALLVPTLTRADALSAARFHYEEGTKAFDLGLYDKAVAEYMAAYQAKNDAALLYNLAQAHRLAGHAREAMRFYTVYLVRLPAAGNRLEVERKIAELKIVIERADAAQTRLQPDTTLPPKPAREPEPAVEPERALPKAPVAVAARPGRGQRIAGLTVGALGLGLLGVGVGFGVLAQQAGDSLTATSRMGGVYDSSLYQSGQTYRVVEGVTLAFGLAATGTGIVLYVLGRRAR